MRRAETKNALVASYICLAEPRLESVFCQARVRNTSLLTARTLSNFLFAAALLAYVLAALARSSYESAVSEFATDFMSRGG